MDWNIYAEEKPEEGDRIVIVCDDLCSTSLGLVTDQGILDGECGEPLPEDFMRGAIWAPLPDGYPLAFTEITEDDWN